MRCLIYGVALASEGQCGAERGREAGGIGQIQRQRAVGTAGGDGDTPSDVVARRRRGLGQMRHTEEDAHKPNEAGKHWLGTEGNPMEWREEA